MVRHFELRHFPSAGYRRTLKSRMFVTVFDSNATAAFELLRPLFWVDGRKTCIDLHRRVSGACVQRY